MKVQEASLNFFENFKILLTGGNQRELARQKQIKKDKGKGKAAAEQAGNKGTNLQTRQQR